MPMAVPGDPVENELVLRRMAEALAMRHALKERPRRSAPAKKRIRDKVKKAEYERAQYARDAIARAKRRFRVMKRDYSRYQWAIKWELAWPRVLQKALGERG